MPSARWVEQDDGVILERGSADKVDRPPEALQSGDSQKLLGGQQGLDVVGHGFVIYPAFSETFTTDHWHLSAQLYEFPYL